jgi:hypothetical protein
MGVGLMGMMHLAPKTASTVAVVDHELVLIEEHAEDHSFASAVDWAKLEESDINFEPARSVRASFFPFCPQDRRGWRRFRSHAIG